MWRAKAGPAELRRRGQGQPPSSPYALQPDGTLSVCARGDWCAQRACSLPIPGGWRPCWPPGRAVCRLSRSARRRTSHAWCSRSRRTAGTCVCLIDVVVAGVQPDVDAAAWPRALGTARRWPARPRGRCQLHGGCAATQARWLACRARSTSPHPDGDGATRQRHLSCSSPKSSAGRPSPAPTLHRKIAGWTSGSRIRTTWFSG